MKTDDNGIMVSVLMSVYNTPLTYLKEAVESILNQTLTNIEYIVVDDCSDKQEVVSYLDQLSNSETRVKLVRNKVNLGLTKSLNVGLASCNGDYIARMDSDDISLPDRLSIQVEYMESHPEVSLVGSNVELFTDQDPVQMLPSNTIKTNDPELYAIRSLIQHSGPPHPTFMFRNSFLKEKGIRYREDILKAQDYGIMVDVLRTGGIIRIIDKPLLKYRIHEGQITSTSETEQMAYQCRISYDYLANVFPTLSSEERTVMSVLGYYGKIGELLGAIRNNEFLNEVCQFVLDNQSSIFNADVYIRSIKKTINDNQNSHKYNGQKLEMVLRYEWWKRAIRLSRELGKPWGMRTYTFASHRFVRKYDSFTNCGLEFET